MGEQRAAEVVPSGTEVSVGHRRENSGGAQVVLCHPRCFRVCSFSPASACADTYGSSGSLAPDLLCQQQHFGSTRRPVGDGLLPAAGDGGTVWRTPRARVTTDGGEE